MSTFADGMRMGQSAYQQVIDNSRQAEKDARDAQTFQDAQTELAYQRKQRTGIDEAITAQQGLATNGKYQGGNTSGFSDGSAEMLYNQDGQKNLDDTASYANVENRRFGLSTPDYKTSTPATAGAPAIPTVQSRAASQLEIEQGYGNIAALQKDVAGMRASTANQKTLRYDEGYSTHLKAWDTMDDTAKGALIKKLSDDTGVKGNGNWTPGTGKLAGYMTYLPPTGDAVKLSNKEAGQLYALTNLMEVDPTRARAEMDKVSDKVASLASHAFEAQTKGVTANNTAVHYAETGDIGRKKIEQDREYAQGALGIRRSEVAAKAKEADPKLVAESNRLAQLYDDATTPGEQAKIKTQFNMVQGQIATSLGKTMQLNDRSGGKPQMSPEMQQKYRDAMQSLGPNTSKPGSTGDSKYQSDKRFIDDLYGVQQTGGAQRVEAPALPSASPGGLKTTSGNHNTATQPQVQTVDKASRIRDIDMRMGLKGIDPEVYLQLSQERDQLVGGIQRFGLNRPPQQYRWNGGASEGIGSGTTDFGNYQGLN